MGVDTSELSETRLHARVVASLELLCLVLVLIRGFQEGRLHKVIGVYLFLVFGEDGDVLCKYLLGFADDVDVVLLVFG